MLTYLIDGNYRPKVKKYIKKIQFQAKIKNFFQNHFQNFKIIILSIMLIFSFMFFGATSVLFSILYF